MADFSGLQIDVRCIKCGRPRTADVTLYEMQNHLYICGECRQKAESSGKNIQWVANVGAETPRTEVPLSPGLRTRDIKNTAPPNSIFAQLGLPLTASSENMETAIKQRMRLLLREEDSPERTQKIEQLHEWQDIVEDPERLDAYRVGLQPRKNAGQALSVGGRLVYTLEEFLNACEEKREGWADGERYLRTGQLQYWIIYQIEDRNLASAILFFQNLKAISTFRAFNQALYCLVPARPFRFYSQESWQPLTAISSASTIEDATRQCDLQWQLGERHLYEGSFCYWLEHSRKVQGLIKYYEAAVAGYANTGRNRGVGLELILERASPLLEKPHLVITFDGTESEYTLEKWDREIPHRPIQLKITNTTRGFAKVHMELEQQPTSTTVPSWLVLNNNTPVDIAGTPGDGSMPATTQIALVNLPLLHRGSTYQRSLNMSIAGAFGQNQQLQKFPVTLKTMSFFRGLRGRLWRFGLRGGFVGFAWNFVVGTLLAFLLYLLIRAFTPAIFPTTNDLSVNSFIQIVLAGVNDLFRPLGSSPYALGLAFPLLVGGIMGVSGWSVGYGKGHADYAEKKGASTFRWWTFWLSVLFVILLLSLNPGGTFLNQALNTPSISNTIDAVYFTGRDIILGILTFFLGCIIATLRYWSEKFLRNHYKDLLNPSGRT